MLLTFNRTDFAYLPFLEITFRPPLLVLTILLALMLISTYPMI